MHLLDCDSSPIQSPLHPLSGDVSLFEKEWMITLEPQIRHKDAAMLSTMVKERARKRSSWQRSEEKLVGDQAVVDDNGEMLAMDRRSRLP
ncbi:hypothetical protein BHM03_00004341 [Ensete ventricosum]|nr:hypothetical protein BHM03_00004341 [Ensete ventricosum]